MTENFENLKKLKNQKNFITITASLKKCSIAIYYEGRLFEINEDSDAPANLVFLAQQLMLKNNINIQEIEGVITASGPGSFTGIRTAQSFAKSIALTLKIPSASIDYFEVIDSIANEKFKNEEFENEADAYRIIAIKSERNQAYFKNIFGGKINVGTTSYEKISELLKEIIEKENRSCILIGDAVKEILEQTNLTADNRGKLQSEEVLDFRNARYLLNFADRINDNSKITPLYINVSENSSLKLNV